MDADEYLAIVIHKRDLYAAIVAKINDDDGGLYVSTWTRPDGTVSVTLDGGIDLTAEEHAAWRALVEKP